MKKKLLLMGLSTALVLGACSKGEEKPKDKEEAKVEVNKEQESKENKKTLSQEERERVVMKNEAKIEDKTLKANVFLENRNAFDIPVMFQKDASVEIRLLDKDGNELEKKVFDENERTEIKSKETLNWQQDFRLKDEFGTFTVEATIFVKQKDGTVIQTFKSTTSVTNEKKQTFEYTPGKKSTLVYENNDGSGNDITEEFLYFDNGYAQAYNTMIGGNTVYLTDSKGYYRVYTEVGERKDNIIKDITPRKELLLQFPVKKGAEWESEGIKHKVIEENYTLDSRVGKLQNVAVVEANIGQIVRFYYHKDYGLVRMDVKNGDGVFQKMMDLKQVKQS